MNFGLSSETLLLKIFLFAFMYEIKLQKCKHLIIHNTHAMDFKGGFKLHSQFYRSVDDDFGNLLI